MLDGLEKQLVADGVPAGEELPAIGDAIRHFRERLVAATNLGESGDDRDVYWLIDELTVAVRLAYPGSRCREGCSGCCDSHTAVFDASPLEWQRLATHMATRWDEARRQEFTAAFTAEHGPRLNAYRLLAFLGHFEPLADAYFARQPYRCPFLLAGRCSVYEARPLACRAYGYFAVRARWTLQPTVYACTMQTDYFQTVRHAQPLHLPSLHTVLARTRRLTRRPAWLPGQGARILPLWIAHAQRAQPSGSVGP